MYIRQQQSYYPTLTRFGYIRLLICYLYLIKEVLHILTFNIILDIGNSKKNPSEIKSGGMAL